MLRHRSPSARVFRISGASWRPVSDGGRTDGRSLEEENFRSARDRTQFVCATSSGVTGKESSTDDATCAGKMRGWKHDTNVTTDRHSDVGHRYASCAYMQWLGRTFHRTSWPSTKCKRKWPRSDDCRYPLLTLTASQGRY